MFHVTRIFLTLQNSHTNKHYALNHYELKHKIKDIEEQTRNEEEEEKKEDHLT